MWSSQMTPYYQNIPSNTLIKIISPRPSLKTPCPGGHKMYIFGRPLPITKYSISNILISASEDSIV